MKDSFADQGVSAFKGALQGGGVFRRREQSLGEGFLIRYGQANNGCALQSAMDGILQSGDYEIRHCPPLKRRRVFQGRMQIRIYSGFETGGR